MIIKPIDDYHIKFLFELLDERTKIQNISHKKLPTYKEHEEFVKYLPYKKWYVIIIDVGMIGSIYLTKKNEIGLFLKKDYCHHAYPHQALAVINERKFHGTSIWLAINPKNEESSNFFRLDIILNHIKSHTKG